MSGWYCKTRVMLRAGSDPDGHGFGPGIEMLLSGIDRLGSLNRVAAEMGMAYSKAWRILKLTEQEFGVQMVERNGAHGSALTPAGREFLENYHQILAAAQQAADEAFARCFPGK